MGNSSGPYAELERLLGRRIREQRTARDWSQAEVAKRMREAGFSWLQTTAAKTEAGERPIRASEAVALAAIFGTTVDTLMEGEVDPLAVRVAHARSAVGLAEAKVRTAEARLRAAEAELRAARAELRWERERVDAVEAAERLRADPSPRVLADAASRLVMLYPDDWADVLAEAGVDPDDIDNARQAAEGQEGEERALTITRHLAGPEVVD